MRTVCWRINRSHRQSYIAQLTREMKEASDELEFERAARLRDQIQMLSVVEQNAVVFDSDVDADFFGVDSDELESFRARAFYVRAGSNRGERNWSVERVEGCDG